MEALALTVLLSAVLAALAATAFVWDRRNRGDDGNWTDDTPDCEYTYYGLLALGNLSL